MRFLIIDRSATMRRIMTNALLRIGYSDAVQAAGCSEGLARLDHTIGFVIVDWKSGPEFAREARANGYQMPIMMVTARGFDEDLAIAEAAGINSCIVKPFTPSVLETRIGRLLNASAA